VNKFFVVGVVAVLEGSNSKSSDRCIGLRADMDGLPQTEVRDVCMMAM
jgi:metal-dependent amidase/aminoacylase/carboxypeptidase family protein